MLADRGGPDGGDAGPVCDPDSGDPAGCPCDPSKATPVDCYSGPPGTSSKGICKPGKRIVHAQRQVHRVRRRSDADRPRRATTPTTTATASSTTSPSSTDAAVIAHCNSPACDPDFADAAITCWGPDPGICGAGTKTCRAGRRCGRRPAAPSSSTAARPRSATASTTTATASVDDGLDQEGACDMPAQSYWPDGSESRSKQAPTAA